MNLLTELATVLAISHLQRPTGQALVSTGRAMQRVGQTLEQTGQRLIEDAPAEPLGVHDVLALRKTAPA